MNKLIITDYSKKIVSAFYSDMELKEQIGRAHV